MYPEEIAQRTNLKELQRILSTDVDHYLQRKQELWDQVRQKYTVISSTQKGKFYGLALDQEKHAIPVMHSDTAFVLFQSLYVPEDLETLLRPFSIGISCGFVDGSGLPGGQCGPLQRC